MSFAEFNALFTRELEVYRQIDIALTAYASEPDSAKAAIIKQLYGQITPLQKQQTELLIQLLESPEFLQQHQTFVHFVTSTTQFRKMQQGHYLQFCLTILKISLCEEGKKLLGMLNELHRQNQLSITTHYSHNEKLFVTMPDLTTKKSNAWFAFLKLVVSCLTNLFMRILAKISQVQRKREFATSPLDTEIHFPQQLMPEAPLLFAGTEQALIIDVDFIGMAHELIHLLHFVIGNFSDTNFPFPTNSAIRMLYSKFYLRANTDELRTIEQPDQYGFSENSFRDAFQLSQRGSHLSTSLECKPTKGLETLLWLSEKRLAAGVLRATEIVSLGVWGTPHGDPRGKIKIPDIENPTGASCTV